MAALTQLCILLRPAEVDYVWFWGYMSRALIYGASCCMVPFFGGSASEAVAWNPPVRPQKGQSNAI
jgi:hypothetical protein